MVVISLLISLHVTSRLDGVFFPGTGASTMVVDGGNHKLLALLCLALGLPLNGRNSSDINFKADLVRWSRSAFGSLHSSDYVSSSH